jgi:hypothetical protein
VDVLAAEIRHVDGGVCWFEGLFLLVDWSECYWLGWLLRDCLSVLEWCVEEKKG